MCKEQTEGENWSDMIWEVCSFAGGQGYEDEICPETIRGEGRLILSASVPENWSAVEDLVLSTVVFGDALALELLLLAKDVEASAFLS